MIQISVVHNSLTMKENYISSHENPFPQFYPGRFRTVSRRERDSRPKKKGEHIFCLIAGGRSPGGEENLGGACLIL